MRDLLSHALLIRSMLIGQTAVTAVTLLCILSGLIIELLCLFGEGELQRGVTVLSHEELLEVTGGFLGIQREGILPLLLQTGIIAVEVPVAVSGILGRAFSQAAFSSSLIFTMVPPASLKASYALERHSLVYSK